MTTQKTRRPSAYEFPARQNSDGNAPGLDGAALDISRAWRRYAIRFLHSSWNSPPVAIGITSSIRGEGRTTGSLCLALGLVEETGSSVALMGLDYEGYGLADAFGILDGPDLEGVLRGTWRVQAALTDVDVPGLAVLPARAGNSRQRLAPRSFWPTLRRQLPDLLTELRKDFGYVVCDLPPLLDNADAGDLAGHMDAVLMLTRAGLTPLRKLDEAMAVLERGRLAGAVHIGSPSALPKWVASLLLE